MNKQNLHNYSNASLSYDWQWHQSVPLNIQKELTVTIMQTLIHIVNTKQLKARLQLIKS